MAYDYEGDDLRQEVRRGYASNPIYYWPKDESGNVALSGGDSCTYTLKSPGGTTLATGTATKSTSSGGSVSLFTITVDASTSASWPLEEGYRAELSWTYSSKTWTDTLRFDCVLEPWRPSVSLNDLAEEVGDASVILTRQAATIISGRTADKHAATLGIKAWGDIRQRLRQAATAAGRIYPRLILDREAVRRVVVAQTIVRMYRWESGGSDSECVEQADRWGAEVSKRFAELGALQYDADEDNAADTVLSGWSSIQTRRTW